MQFPHLRWKEISLYLAYHLGPQEELEAENIYQFIGKRRTNRGRPPELATAGSKNKEEERFQAWVLPEVEPNEIQKRKMFCIAIEEMICAIMSSHDFTFDGKIYKQQ